MIKYCRSPQDPLWNTHTSLFTCHLVFKNLKFHKDSSPLLIVCIKIHAFHSFFLSISSKSGGEYVVLKPPESNRVKFTLEPRLAARKSQWQIALLGPVSSPLDIGGSNKKATITLFLLQARSKGPGSLQSY